MDAENGLGDTFSRLIAHGSEDETGNQDTVGLVTLFQRNEPVCPVDSQPLSQGYWHRQCLGLSANDLDCPGIDPGRNGRGPQSTTEPGFCPDLYDCANVRLEGLESSFGETTCEGMDADPPSDHCEKALKQLTALILNVCSERLGDSCEVDVSAERCTSTTVGELISEIDDLILSGFCTEAAACAGAVNEGDAVVDGGGGGTLGHSDPTGIDTPEFDLRPLRFWKSAALREEDIWNVRLGYKGRDLHGYLVPGSFFVEYGVAPPGTPYYLVPIDFDPGNPEASEVSVDADAAVVGKVDRERKRKKSRR